MKKILTCCFAVICLVNLPVAAQDAYAGGFLQNYGVAVKVSTLGIGADFITALHPNIKVRLGLNYAGFIKPDINMEFKGKSINLPKHDVPVQVKNVSTDLLTGNLLVDLFPLKSLGLHLTVGLYVGKTDLAVTGSANEDFQVEGYVVKPNRDGSMKASLRFGSLFKPYAGLGFGRTIPKSIVGFKLDAGLIYQGTYKIVGENTTEDLNHEVTKLWEEWNIPEFFKTFYPVVSLSLIFRIK